MAPSEPDADGKEPRRARQVAQQRAAIIEAAARAFAQAGYEATTMRAIAKEAGYTASSLYTYFASKEEIFAALVDELHDAVVAVFDEPVPEGLSFAQRLELLHLRQMELIERKAPVFAFLFSNACTAAPLAGLTQHPEKQATYVDRFEQWIAAHAAAADLGGTAPRDVAYFIWGVHHGFFVQWLRTDPRPRLRDRVPVITKLLLHGLS